MECFGNLPELCYRRGKIVDALLTTLGNEVGANLSSQRQNLIDLFNAGGRGNVLYRVADADAQGRSFWLNVQNNGVNYRGMVCSFITATEYQRRFSTVVPNSNADCAK